MGDADFKRSKELQDATKIIDSDVLEVNNYAITHSPCWNFQESNYQEGIRLTCI